MYKQIEYEYDECDHHTVMMIMIEYKIPPPLCVLKKRNTFPLTVSWKLLHFQIFCYIICVGQTAFTKSIGLAGSQGPEGPYDSSLS